MTGNLRFGGQRSAVLAACFTPEPEAGNHAKDKAMRRAPQLHMPLFICGVASVTSRNHMAYN
jgi:hypothetical protein